MPCGATTQARVPALEPQCRGRQGMQPDAMRCIPAGYCRQRTYWSSVRCISLLRDYARFASWLLEKSRKAHVAQA